MPEKNEILNLEKRYWDAMKANDVEAAVGLTKFPCTLTSPKGVRKVSEEEYRSLMSSHDGNRFAQVEVGDPQIDILTDDVAMISYSTEINDMKMLDVSTWVRDGDRWACAYHSENPLH